MVYLWSNASTLGFSGLGRLAVKIGPSSRWAGRALGSPSSKGAFSRGAVVSSSSVRL